MNVARLVVPLQAEIVQRLLADKCELCDSTEQIEVHHIRKLADIKKKYLFMMQRNRKTVVVCRKCHEQIHSGTYDGVKLT
jgi:predicted HNH restriction endonuclease